MQDQKEMPLVRKNSLMNRKSSISLESQVQSMTLNTQGSEPLIKNLHTRKYQLGEAFEGEDLIAYESKIAPGLILKVDDVIPLVVRQEKVSLSPERKRKAL